MSASMLQAQNIDIQQHLSKVRDHVRASGFVVVDLQDTPALAYTVGLSLKGLPELVVVGLPTVISRQILTHVGRQLLESSLDLVPGARYEGVFEKMPVELAPLDPLLCANHMAALTALLGERPAQGMWQLLWPDKNGRFPKDTGVLPGAREAQQFAMTGASVGMH